MYTLLMQAMLTYFSQFLFLAPLSATLLRIVAGAFFGYVGYRVVLKREELLRIKLPVVVHARAWMLWLAVIITWLVAAMLFIGFMTQLAALLGALIAIKLFVLEPRLRHLGLLSRSTCFLLLVICLSIFMTGAGLFAYDLPLY